MVQSRAIIDTEGGASNARKVGLVLRANSHPSSGPRGLDDILPGLRARGETTHKAPIGTLRTPLFGGLSVALHQQSEHLALSTEHLDSGSI